MFHILYKLRIFNCHCRLSLRKRSNLLFLRLLCSLTMTKKGVSIVIAEKILKTLIKKSNIIIFLYLCIHIILCLQSIKALLKITLNYNLLVLNFSPVIYLINLNITINTVITVNPIAINLNIISNRLFISSRNSIIL